MTLKSALLVDDSKLARITLKKLLEKRNLDVTMCASAQEALDWLKSNQADVVFMDHLMPEMDGLEAMTIMKRDPSLAAIPVVMCTGKEGDNYEETVRQAGAIGFLAKPPEPEQLEIVLKRVENAIEMGTVVQPVAPAAPPEAETSDIQSQLAALEKKLLDTLNEQMEMARAEFEAHKQELIGSLPSSADAGAISDEFNARLDAVGKKTEDINALFSDFESRVSQLTSELDALKSAVSEPAADADIKQRLDALEAGASRAEQVETSGVEASDVRDIVANALKDDYRITPETVPQILSELDTLKQAGASAEGGSSEADLSELRNELEQKVAELVTAVDEKLSSAFQSLEQKVETLSTSEPAPAQIPMDDLKLELSDLAGKEVEKRLETIWTQQQATVNEIRSSIRDEVSRAVSEHVPESSESGDSGVEDQVAALKSELVTVQQQLAQTQQKNLVGWILVGVLAAGALAKAFGAF